MRTEYLSILLRRCHGDGVLELVRFTIIIKARLWWIADTSGALARGGTRRPSCAGTASPRRWPPALRVLDRRELIGHSQLICLYWDANWERSRC